MGGHGAFELEAYQVVDDAESYVLRVCVYKVLKRILHVHIREHVGHRLNDNQSLSRITHRRHGDGDNPDYHKVNKELTQRVLELAKRKVSATNDAYPIGTHPAKDVEREKHEQG